jgi:hypothetical protein
MFSRTVRRVRARSSSWICSGDLFSVGVLTRALAPPAQRRRADGARCFLRRRPDSVSWRRDSAVERLAIEVERSRRRRAVEESMESRSVSLRGLLWGVLVLVLVLDGVEVVGLVRREVVRGWTVGVVER